MYGWQRYLSIEQEFLMVRQFVPYSMMGCAYSEFFTRQVIILGSEIEAAFKKVCEFAGLSGAGNMGQYKQTILGAYPKIEEWSCVIKTEDITLRPFEGWSGKLPWWGIYTNVKHGLVDKDATYEIALKMLGAYELLLLLVEATDPDREELTDKAIGGAIWNEMAENGKTKRYTCIDCPALLVPDIEFGIGDGVNGLPGIAFYPEHVLEQVK